jgi:hypothetical protein
VLRAKEHALTPSPFIVFTFGFGIESIKELGGLALVEKNTLVPIEVIYSWNLSLWQVTHETKTLVVTIGSHISKVVCNVISSPINHVIVGLSWLVVMVMENYKNKN